jgi:hypothetical protein
MFQALGIVEVAERFLANNFADQASLFEGFLSGDLSWFLALHRPALGDHPSTCLT